MSQKLNLDNVLIRIHSQVTPKWYQFGQALGVEKKVLDKYINNSAEVSVVKVLDYWIRNHYAEPTWKDIAEALSEIELAQLAEEILM